MFYPSAKKTRKSVHRARCVFLDITKGWNSMFQGCRDKSDGTQEHVTVGKSDSEHHQNQPAMNRDLCDWNDFFSWSAFSNLIAFTKDGSDPFIRLYLLPDKSRTGRRKTGTMKRTLNPIYDQTWVCVTVFPTLPSLHKLKRVIFLWHHHRRQVWVQRLHGGAAQEDFRCSGEEQRRDPVETQRASRKSKTCF